MYSVNRSILIVKPKQPYIVWANHCDDEEPKLTLEAATKDATVFLIPEVESKEDEDKVLRKYYKEIFEFELSWWVTDENIWPKKRDLKTFREWFEIQFHGVAMDLGEEQIWRERE